MKIILNALHEQIYFYNLFVYLLILQHFIFKSNYSVEIKNFISTKIFITRNLYRIILY